MFNFIHVGRHSSLPLNSPKPRLSTERRANTLSGGQSATQITNIDQNSETFPHQESDQDCGDADTDIHFANSSRLQNSLRDTSMSSEPLETPAVGDEAPFYSARRQQFHDMMMMSSHQSHDQMRTSHDQMHQSHDRITRGRRMPKQTSFELIEATRTPQTAAMHRSSSSTAPVIVRSLDGQSNLHGNVSSDLLLNNPIHGQLVWKFNSNPSSSNVSQENILASSSHSDVNVPVSSPRVLVQPHHQHASNHHPRSPSNSNPLSQELQALMGIQNHHSPVATSNSHHAVNHQVISPSFHVGNYLEAVATPYATQRSCPVHRTLSGHSLSQGSCCHYCVVQPCNCHDQQCVVGVAPNITNGYPSQEHISPVVVGSNVNTHIPHHHHSNSYNNSGTDSRCTSRTSMRQPSAAGIVQQPPQLFPTAYPSTQNIAQQTFLSSSLYTPPRHPRQPPMVTRHLSLVTPQHDHTQAQGGHTPHRYSGYTTDGSGPDDVFQSFSEDHLLAAPERASTHPQVGTGAKSTRHQRSRVSQDPLSDHIDSTLTSNRRMAGHSGTRGSEISMEMPFMGGPAGAGMSEKSGSKHVWDVTTSQSGDLNDADSGFIGSAPHGINGETRRSFTPSASAKLQTCTELKKLPLSQPSMTSNSVSGFSHLPGAESSQKSKPKKKHPSSHNHEQENSVYEADPPSDDNIPVVYKDDDESWKSSTTRRSKDRAIKRGGVQYRSLRYERDRQIQRRGKPNRSSLQSFDGNTLDSLQLERASGRTSKHTPKSPGSTNGHGSAHSLRSKSSQDTLNTLAVSVPQGRNLQPVGGVGGHHHYRHTKDENGKPT